MGSGPVLIFDKSLLESLSPDEAVWLGQFYYVNMTPVFFVETLADLELQRVPEGRTAEGIVARLAEKTSVLSANANAHHATLSMADLLGYKVDMRGVVVMTGGDSVERDGRKGLVFKEGPEAQALSRWRSGRFNEIEREHAKAWRAALETIDLDATFERFRPMMKLENRPRTLKEVKAVVDAVLNNPAIAENVLGVTFQMLGLPYERWGEVFARWKTGGRPPLVSFAPFVAHVMSVELFLAIAVGGGFISKERATNKVDMAYLYYLPFCMVFTSMDKLHARTVPLFLKGKQQFVWGAELKSDLKRLDEHFSKLPEEVKAKGVMSFAHYPPLDDSFLTTRLWDHFMSPRWRTPKPVEPDSPEKVERHRELIKEMRSLGDAGPANRKIHVDSADFVMMQHSVPAKLGKWAIVPPESSKNPRR